MATTRFNYIGDFSGKGQGVGIGTSTPTEALEVLGTVRGKDIEVTGIATLTSYRGFDNIKTSYVDNIVIGGGESGTLSGEVVIGAGLTMSVGTGATTGQGNIKSLKVSNTFTPPIGGTNDRPSAPQPGSLYYNKDFKTIEYWDGRFWRQVDNVVTRGRGLCSGGNNAAAHPTANHCPSIDYFDIATTGNANDFGELAQSAAQHSSYGSAIRGVWNGFGESSTTQDYMQYNVFASLGNAVDFANLTVDRRMSGACASSTRGIIAGGKKGPAAQDVIDYCEVASLGNAIDFGNLSLARRLHNCCAASATRAVFCAGADPSTAIIDSVHIATTGNATQFGEAIWAGNYKAGCSNSTRGFWGTGYCNSNMKTVEYQVFASGGNTTYFGDLTKTRHGAGAASTQTRACWTGGYNAAVSTSVNTIDYVSMTTTGSAQDFGDLSDQRSYVSSCSDSAGGLGGY